MIYHISARTGRIPKPGAPNDLVGSSSANCACMPYIHMVCIAQSARI